jgi:anti-sigma factor RsiW
MNSRVPSEGNRNALLALHFGELDAPSEAACRAHLADCAECRTYLSTLEQVDRALRCWGEEAPPDGVRERTLARIGRAAQRVPRRRRSQTALPLLALVPAMAAAVALTSVVATRLADWACWERLAVWPGVSLLGAFGVTALLMLIAGGLGSLALAPALVLESRKSGRAAAAWR